MEDRRKPGGEALDKYFEHHVGLGDPVMRTGKRNVVDLDEERSLIDRTELEGLAIERPAVPAWGIRREGGLDGGDGSGGLRLRRSTRSCRGRGARGEEEQDDGDEGEQACVRCALPHLFRL